MIRNRFSPVATGMVVMKCLAEDGVPVWEADGSLRFVCKQPRQFGVREKHKIRAPLFSYEFYDVPPDVLEEVRKGNDRFWVEWFKQFFGENFDAEFERAVARARGRRTAKVQELEKKFESMGSLGKSLWKKSIKFS